MPSEMGDVEKSVLRALRGRSAVHMRDLLKETGLPIGKLLPVVRSLEKRGLLRSFRHGGYSFFSLTEEGKEEAAKVEVPIPPLNSPGGESELREESGNVEGSLGDRDPGPL